MFNDDDIEFNGDSQYFENGNQNGEKSKVVSMVLCFLLGFLGVHRFYLGKIGTGILWLITCGFCGIGVLVDFVRICLNKITDKNGNPLKNDISDSVSKILAIVFVLIYIGSLFVSIAGLIAFTKGMFDLTKDVVNDVTEVVEQLPEDLENITSEDLEALIPDNIEITINDETITTEDNITEDNTHDSLNDLNFEEPIVDNSVVEEPIINEIEENPDVNPSMIFVTSNGLYNSMVRSVDDYLARYPKWDYRDIGSNGYSTDIGSFEYGVESGTLQELYDMFNNKFAFMSDVVITNIDVMSGKVELINYYTYERYLNGELESLDNVYKVTGYLFPGSMVESRNNFIAIGDRIEVGGIFRNISYEGFDFYITSAYGW